MLPRMRVRLGLTLVAFLAGPASALADVWVVDRLGAGDFTEIQPAVDAASDGDTILVRHDGTNVRYGRTVVIGKGLVLMGEDARARTGRIEIQDLPVGSRMVVANFDVLGTDLRPALSVQDASGFVLVEASRVETWWYAAACELRAAANVVFVHSTVIGGRGNWDVPGSSALVAESSNVAAYACTITGGHCETNLGWEPAVDGGAGVVVNGGSFHAAGCSIEGGHGQDTFVFRLGGTGGSGVEIAPPARAWVIDTQIEGGSGGAGCCGLSGEDGEAFTGRLIAIDGARAKDIEAPPWGIEGRTAHVTLTGTPGDETWLLLSSAPRSLLVDPEVGFLHLGPPSPERIALVTLPATGVEVVPFDLLAVPTGEAVELYLQAAHVEASGDLRLGPVTHLTVFDESAVPPYGGRFFVDADAAPGGDGLTWASAFSDLHDALAAARGCLAHAAEVWVAEGTYRPDAPSGNPARSFSVQSGTHVYGGFAGTETELAQRDPRAHPTRLDGDLNADDGPNFTGRDDNSIHVVRAGLDGYATVRNVRLDGLSVRGGNARMVGLDDLDDGGGGMLLLGEVDVVSCTVEDSQALVGGGILAWGSRLRLVNDVVRGNRAVSAGGVEWSSPPRLLPSDVHQVVGSLFIGNQATSYGNTLRFNAPLAGCRLELLGSTFAANLGVANESIDVHHVALVVRNCILWGNSGGELDAQEALSLEIDYSCFQGLPDGQGGVGNIDQDPQFADLLGPDGVAGTADDDPRPLPGSPCNDAGDVPGLAADLLDMDRDAQLGEPVPRDLDGRRRRADDPAAPDVGNGAAPLVDMGAFELRSGP